MAKIPLYNQEKLASSLVGTPGVNPAGEIMAKAILTNSGELTASEVQGERQQASMTAQATNQSFGMLEGALQANQVARQRAEVHQAALDSARDTMTDTLNASNHATLWGVQANDAATKIMMNGAIPPDGRPAALTAALLDSRNQYQQDTPMTEGEMSKFIEHTNPTILEYNNQANKSYRTFAAQQALSLQKTTDSEVAKTIDTPEKLLALKEQLSEPATMNKRAIAYGPNNEAAAKVLLTNSQINLANVMAKDAKLLMKADGTQTSDVEAARATLFNEIPETKWKAIAQYARHTIQGAQTEALKDVTLGAHQARLGLTAVRGLVDEHHNQNDYGQMLAAGRKQAADIFEEQLKLKEFQTGDPVRDKEGRLVPYRNEHVIKDATALMEYLDGQATVFNHSMEKVYKEQIGAVAAEDKQANQENVQTINKAVAEQKSRVASTALPNTEGHAIYTNLTQNIAHLHNSGVPDTQALIPTKAADAYLAGHDETQSYLHAVAAYSQAVHGGYLTQGEQKKYGEYLQLVGDRLKGGSPGPSDKITLEGSLKMLTAAAPAGLTYLLTKYGGYTKNAVDREVLARTIRMYDRAQQLVPGAVPSPQVVEMMRAAAEKDMKTHVQERQQRLVPPPPPMVLMAPQMMPQNFTPVQPDTAALQEQIPDLPGFEGNMLNNAAE